MSHSRMSLTRYGGPQANYHQSTKQLFEKAPYQVIQPIETLPKLLTDFKKLFEQTQNNECNLHDVILVVENDRDKKEVLAQKQLLIARSGYFENVVFGDLDTVEAEANKFTKVDEPDGKTKVVFKSDLCDDIFLLREVVEYMYWGYWEHSDLSRSEKIFELAAQLDLKELRNNVSNELSKYLNERNVVKYLFMADKHDGRILKQRCIDFILINRLQVHPELDRKIANKSTDDQNRVVKLIGEIYKRDVISRKPSTQQ